LKDEENAMKKSLTSIMLILAALLWCGVSMFAQTQSAPPSSQGANAQQPTTVSDKDIEMLRQDLRDQRKQLVALNLPLTADEATKFWPIFDQYRKDAIKPNDQRWEVIKAYASNYDTMTDAQAQDYMKRANAVDEELLALRMRYVPKFETAISPKKTALLYQIDRRIDLLINLQLSSEIPMVNAK
jgi:Spy/CpxP family protein refolding chaperone